MAYIAENNFKDIPFDIIRPDKNNNWINLSENDFETHLPLLNKANNKSIFSLNTNGISTNRDEWVYDYSISNAIAKATFFIEEYNFEVERWKEYKKEKNYLDIKKESNPVVDNFLEERNFIKWSKMIKRVSIPMMVPPLTDPWYPP